MPWTEITRGQYCRDDMTCASDLTGAERAIIASMMPFACGLVVHATRTYAGWSKYLVYRLDGMPMARLPKVFPPYSTVQGYFYAWSRSGLFSSINHALVMQARDATGREASPLAGVYAGRLEWFDENGCERDATVPHKGGNGVCQTSSRQDDFLAELLDNSLYVESFGKQK